MRIIQRYKMKWKVKFDQKKIVFLSQEIIFFRAIFPGESQYKRFRFRLENIFFYFTFKICFEINLVILYTWIRIRNWIRIQITAKKAKEGKGSKKGSIPLLFKIYLWRQHTYVRPCLFHGCFAVKHEIVMAAVGGRFPFMLLLAE